MPADREPTPAEGEPTPADLESTTVNVARVVYGTVVVGALLAAEAPERETYAETMASVLIALLVYWMAHSYAELTARRIAERGRLTAIALVDSMRHEAWIIFGASVPVLPLLIWWIAGGAITDAVSAAIWTSAGMIVVYELIAGIRAELTAKQMAVQIALGAMLGLLVIALKLVLH
jgi:membrane protein YqaA with SNARE-associated domain